MNPKGLELLKKQDRKYLGIIKIRKLIINIKLPLK